MIKKILLGLLIVIVVAVIGIFTFIQLSWNKVYDVPLPALTTSTDSAVIARGEYFVKGPAHCVGCHVGTFDEIMKAEMGGDIPLSGGYAFHIGPLGTLYSANLTPDKETGIGRYSVGEVFRMMRHGIKPDGTSTLAPLMPFQEMSNDDMVAIVSYLMSQEPVRNDVPKTEYSLLGKAIRTFTPVFDPVLEPEVPSQSPPEEVTIERGRYLVRSVANCLGCHTMRDEKTMAVVGEEFGGGMQFEPIPELNKMAGSDPDVWTRSPNITRGGVLTKFEDEQAWIARFRQGRIILQSPMPWSSFKSITDTDLAAIYMYLKSLDPVDHDPGPVIFKKTAE